MDLFTLAATAAICASALLFLIALRPVEVMAGCVALLVCASPKAGIKLSFLPLPIVLFTVIIIGHLIGRKSTRMGKFSAAAAVFGSWIVIRLGLLLGSGAPLSEAAALLGWTVAPFLFLSSVRRLVHSANGVRFLRLGLELGFAIACLYALLQRVVGITATTVPGVTLALFDSYTDKFNGLGQLGSKIPSTYQGGNNFGIIAAVFLVWYLAELSLGRSRRIPYATASVLAGLAAVGLFLSGSRTAFFGALAGVLVLGLVRISTKRFLILLGACLLGLSVLILLPDDLTRLTNFDPTASGRTLDWAAMLRSSSLLSLLFGSTGWALNRGLLVEGVLGAVQQVGLVGVVLFSLAYAGRFRFSDIPAAVLLAPVAVSFLVDSTYLVFPTLFIPLLIGTAGDSTLRSSLPARRQEGRGLYHRHRTYSVRDDASVAPMRQSLVQESGEVSFT